MQISCQGNPRLWQYCVKKIKESTTSNFWQAVKILWICAKVKPEQSLKSNVFSVGPFLSMLGTNRAVFEIKVRAIYFLNKLPHLFFS